MGNIVVIGAGAWGTALAIALSKRHTVRLLMRTKEQLARLSLDRENKQYLSGIPLPQTLLVGLFSKDGCQDADAYVVAVPVSGFRSVIHKLHQWVEQPVVVSTCKGFEAITNLTPREIYQNLLGHLDGFFVLSGPTFSREVAFGKPCAIVLAAENLFSSHPLFEILSSPTWSLFPSNDLVGVEWGGALKNILAIAIGLCDGLCLGMNARAALLCFGMSEMEHLSRYHGAKSSTVFGLSGLGDLILTATGDLSRNRQLGIALAKGELLEDIMVRLGQVTEGVYACRGLMSRMQGHSISLPIAQMVYDVIENAAVPAERMQLLFAETWHYS